MEDRKKISSKNVSKTRIFKTQLRSLETGIDRDKWGDQTENVIDFDWVPHIFGPISTIQSLKLTQNISLYIPTPFQEIKSER